MSNKEEKIKELVESIGVYFQKDGRQPIMGRIWGYLLVSEPPYKTFDEIVTYLQASKSAVSNALTLLQYLNMVEYITFSGDRKRYFKVDFDGLEEYTMKAFDEIKEFKVLLKNINAVRSNKYPEIKNGITNLISMYDLFEEESRKILEKWKKSKK